MNKIFYITHRVGGFLPKFSRIASLAFFGFFSSNPSSVKSDTNRETKGSFLNNIPSPLISLCSLLVHMVGIDVYPNSHLSFSSSQTILFNYLYKPSQHRSQQTGGCVHT